MKKILTSLEVRKIIDRYRIKMDSFIINNDGTVDVNGSVVITRTNLTHLPLHFNRVSGQFNCSNNKLTTLKGAPNFIGRSFDCSNNNLCSLKYVPKKVGGDFLCFENSLKSLNGIQKIIYAGLFCFDNKLKTLEGGPVEVYNDFNVEYNNLVNLIGSPVKVGGYFFARGNIFENLLGCSRFIGQTLYLGVSTKSLNIGKHDCILKSIRFEFVEESGFPFLIPMIIYKNQKNLRLIMKYHEMLDLWDDKGELIIQNFEDMILEIKEGFQ